MSTKIFTDIIRAEFDRALEEITNLAIQEAEARIRRRMAEIAVSMFSEYDMRRDGNVLQIQVRLRQ